jgi:hypothetical protein
MNQPEPVPTSGARHAAGGQSQTDPAAGMGRGYQILLDGMIGVYDLSANAAVQTYITHVLQRIGVNRELMDIGAEFDADACEAVSMVVTDDPGRHHRVAETIRPGWRGPDMVLRPPQVSVWVCDPVTKGG